jgi:hypothetical protein
MALVKDAKGAVVERLSNTYPLEGPLENRRRCSGQRDLRQLWLGPGRYTLTTVVRDQQADKVGVRRLPIRVFPEAPGIDVSTVAVVKRGQGQRRADPVEDPFRTARCESRRSLATPIEGRQPQDLRPSSPYPDKAIADAPNLTIEFAQGSTIVGRSSPRWTSRTRTADHLRRDVPRMVRAGHV